MTEPSFVAAARHASGRVCGAGIAGALLAVALSATANAQSNYPNRPIQLVVPYGAGGIADVTMRIPADKLSEPLGQQSSSTTGRAPAASSPRRPSHGGARRLHPVDDRQRPPTPSVAVQVAALRPGEGFRADLDRSAYGLVIVAKADSAEDGRRHHRGRQGQPGKMNIGTINPGSTQNLAAELFRSMATSR